MLAMIVLLARTIVRFIPEHFTIFQLEKPMLLKHFFLFTLFILATPIAGAETLWGKGGFAGLCQQLEPVSPTALKSHLGDYLAVLKERESVSTAGIRAARLADMEPLLARAAAMNWGVLEVFTQKEFAGADGCALFMDQRTLAELHKKFDLHGVWQITARLAEDQQQTLPMRYMIVGQGHLIIGYPREATVEISDGDAVKGKYNYTPFLSAQIENSASARGLFKIRTLRSPAAEYESFIGPYDVQIKALQLLGGDILVKYSWGFEQEKRTRNVPIAMRD